MPGQLVPEPENAADPNPVAVHVEGERVGYLPGYVAAQIALQPDEVLDCQVQMWAADDRGRLRVIGWAAYGTGPVAWPHTAQTPPAVTVAEQRAERAAATTDMVDQGLTSADPGRAGQVKRGMVGRYHYLETVEPIHQLKREGRLKRHSTSAAARSAPPKRTVTVASPRLGTPSRRPSSTASAASGT